MMLLGGLPRTLFWNRNNALNTKLMLKNLYNKKIQQASASCKKGRTLTHKKKNLFCSLSNRGVVRAIVNGHQQG